MQEILTADLESPRMVLSKKILIFFCLGLDIRVSEVVEADLPQPVLSEHNLKVLCDEVGGIRSA